jgi:hypothetical protein
VTLAIVSRSKALRFASSGSPDVAGIEAMAFIYLPLLTVGGQ